MQHGRVPSPLPDPFVLPPPSPLSSALTIKEQNSVLLQIARFHITRPANLANGTRSPFYALHARSVLQSKRGTQDEREGFLHFIVRKQRPWKGTELSTTGTSVNTEDVCVTRPATGAPPSPCLYSYAEFSSSKAKQDK